MVASDFRQTDRYREAESIYRLTRQPATGLICDATEIQASPDGQYAVFVGTFTERLDAARLTRICQVDLSSGSTRVLTFGSNRDHSPKYSPDGRYIAFVSDRHAAGNFQLYLLDVNTGAARAASPLDGWLEYLQWSPDGKRILLGVAGHGADVSSAQGSIRSRRHAEDAPSWAPTVDASGLQCRWRRVWIYDLKTGRATPFPAAECNVWHAVWCGDQSIAAVVSQGPGEGLWYSAQLVAIDLKTAQKRLLLAPEHQLGSLAASPSGDFLAVVEAVGSDRGVVAGDLKLIEVRSGRVTPVNTRGVDVSCAEWRCVRQLLLAGHRGFETVVGIYDVTADSFEETWASDEVSTSGHHASVSGIGTTGNFVLIGESFFRPPEIAVIQNGRYRTLKSFGIDVAEKLTASCAEKIRWRAADGLELQGWLLLPDSEGPYPLVMNIHGGPVWHWRPTWLGRYGIATLMLLKRGYAIFLPNPRGSSGRGLEFAQRILGDIGGADTQDLLSGIDHLVERGVADAKRLGVTGGSYGGYMTAWLITQDARFRAAVAIAPSTNLVSKYLISTIPQFVSLFYGDIYANPGGKFFQRSPIMHAHKAKTPTLSICGALDRTTPPAEAVQFHNALLENGTESVLVTYPEEGHGIKTLPEAIDCAARTVAWFEEHVQKQHAA